MRKYLVSPRGEDTLLEFTSAKVQDPLTSP